MFGYITPLTPELKVREYHTFRSYYCGLCFHIKSHFGNIPRMALNYDMTFLGVLLDSLSDNELKIQRKRCIVHPINKHAIVENNPALIYAAEMNVSLFYSKLVDDVNDDNDFKSKIGTLVLSPYKRKFSKETNFINDLIEKELNNLSKLEKSKNFNSLDEIAHPFSELVGNIFKLYPYKLKNDSLELRDSLYSMGYALGKWIYIIDALDDLKDDMEKNKFNPINHLYNTENLCYDDFLHTITSRVEFTILNLGATCLEHLKSFNLSRNKETLENIIELGMMDKYSKIINPCKCNDKKRSVCKHESI